jgi:hypothetical protein
VLAGLGDTETQRCSSVAKVGECSQWPICNVLEDRFKNVSLSVAGLKNIGHVYNVGSLDIS